MAATDTVFEFESFFLTHYDRIARAVRRVVGDASRAEDIAVEAFWRLSRESQAQHENAGGWVYRTALRLSLNELRRTERRARYEHLAAWFHRVRTPEEVHVEAEEQRQVRAVLAALEPRKAEVLLLRSDGFSYAELASALDMNPASVGTFLSRAQEAFRKEYVKRYGTR
jgi:RNA polymerase sigma-70 factor, ECF subfamily